MAWLNSCRRLLLLQYKGQDGYCMANSTGRVGKFKVGVSAWQGAACSVPQRGPAARSLYGIAECTRGACFLAQNGHAVVAPMLLARAMLTMARPQTRHPRCPLPSRQGFARVPRYDDAALREALLSRGPLAISFDASHPSFRFYSGGVYREEQVGHALGRCAASVSCLQCEARLLRRTSGCAPCAWAMLVSKNLDIAHCAACCVWSPPPLHAFIPPTYPATNTVACPSSTSTSTSTSTSLNPATPSTCQARSASTSRWAWTTTSCWWAMAPRPRATTGEGADGEGTGHQAAQGRAPCVS